MGTISINMKQMSKWNVTSDNVKYFDIIQVNKGKFFTLDSRTIQELLNEFSIFYTFKI